MNREPPRITFRVLKMASCPKGKAVESVNFTVVARVPPLSNAQREVLMTHILKQRSSKTGKLTVLPICTPLIFPRKNSITKSEVVYTYMGSVYVRTCTCMGPWGRLLHFFFSFNTQNLIRKQYQVVLVSVATGNWSYLHVCKQCGLQTTTNGYNGETCAALNHKL